MMKKTISILSLIALASCGAIHQNQKKTATIQEQNKPFVWQGANVYFLLTDRFNNGDTTNDINFGRSKYGTALRGFEGGDIKGITQKIEDGYFSELGVNAIWTTPLVEQVHGAVDEGWGKNYGFHGYWAKDWTTFDPNFGTEKDFADYVEKAHSKGIRVILDVVLNHTGPVTDIDEVYPSTWVRTSPECVYKNYETTTACTLVKNLPDILTEYNTPAELPKMLEEKWKKEGRYEQEMKSLNDFFARYNFPKAPKYYIMKWLSDYIRKYGVDGFRVDTVKHINEDAWKEFQKVCQDSFDEYKRNNPTKVLDNNDFFMVGEVYGYGISQKQDYNFGDRKVNYFDNGFGYLINFDFKGDANKSYQEIFSNYSNILNTDMKGLGVMNYISSHDDGEPFDKNREKSIESATKLLLAPGISQIYYGDETARLLTSPNASGDATLRTVMNWEELKNNPNTQKILTHWQKLGKFRASHPAVGAGVHQMISSSPYWFSRVYTQGKFTDKVIIGIDLVRGNKSVSVEGIFKEGDKVRDAYTGTITKVSEGKVNISTPETIVLLEKIN